MANSIPEKMLVALSETPSDFWAGKFKIVPPDQARVSAFDRSFHFGDSVYEVARTYEGIAFGLQEHMDRLGRSAKQACFKKFPPPALFMNMIQKTCKQWFETFGNQEIYIRWMLSRGVSDLNINPEISSDPHGFVFVKALEAPTPADFEAGMHYIIAKRQRNDPRALEPSMKSGNYLNNVLALAEAKARGAHDAVMLSHEGHVTEGTTNNVYMIKNGEVLTAPLSVGILEGITRQWIFSAAKTLGIPCKEALISTTQFEAADELFMSSSVKEIQPITKLNDNKVQNGQPGPITRRLALELKNIIQQHIKEHRHESLFS